MCQLLWALGNLRYEPAGRALPAWLNQHLLSVVCPAGPHSSSSSGNSGSIDSSSSSSGGSCLFVGVSESSAVQLLVGLRGCRVVLSGTWLSQLLLASQAQAGTLPRQVGSFGVVCMECVCCDLGLCLRNILLG